MNIAMKMCNFPNTLLSLHLVVMCSVVYGQGSQATVLMDVPGYPVMFELNEGEEYTVKRTYKDLTLERTIKVKSIRHYTEDNPWFSPQLPPTNYSLAFVAVDVSGESATLLHRPYESPATVNGLRIYVEATKEWASSAELAGIKDMSRQVRLSVCLAGEPWGPDDLMFPIKEYRWRSAAYNNTWSSLVPYNKLYYHRGEDYGAIPDILDVVSPTDGKITATPLPDGDGKSNAVFVENADGVVFRISHMNIETINKANVVGTAVTKGTILGKTGMTWDGRKSQVSDPHCHIDIAYKDHVLGSFPYLIESYFRTYRDPVLAVAGGYHFTTVNSTVRLDANRSIAYGGKAIKTYSWKLHNGETHNGPVKVVTYREPGLFTEELIVTTADGHEDRDFVQVRVYAKDQSKTGMGYGWAYYSPVRGIAPGQEIVFWNRLVNTNGPVKINFGDRPKWETIDKSLTHVYKKAGIYTVTLKGVDVQGLPVVVKVEVRVG